MIVIAKERRWVSFVIRSLQRLRYKRVKRKVVEYDSTTGTITIDKKL